MKITRRSKIAASKGSVTSSNNINRQREYEYRRNLYLKRKHEFETLGEEGNNDVLSREDKMNIAKAEMDKVAPKPVNSAEEYESEWTELASKSVLDSDGFYTDYTLYTNGSTFICMFGDKDIYEPDEMYADYETDDEEAAYSWFDHYEGFSDEDEEFFDVSSAATITASEDTDDLWEVIDDEEFEFSGVQDVGYDDDGNIMVIFNHAISEDMIEPTAEELLIAFRQYGYPVHEWNTNGNNIFILSRGGILGSTAANLEYEDDIQEIDQEFTSENTSINSGKLPAIFKMINLEPGTINIDYGGGRFDNVAEYLTQYDVVNLVYDPYNRSKEHNQEVIRTVKAAGGADTATCSNVLNVIKEPEVRQNVLQNIRKLVKPNGNIYITVYEGSGKGNEGPTKSGYQLNRKTADYLEEIQQVFPNAKRRGKLIVATNSGSVNSSTDITKESSNPRIIEASYGRAFDIEDDRYNGSIRLTDEQMAQVDEIADRYCTSRPVSGDWDTEVEHQAYAIADALDISIDEAKTIMKDYLGFTDEQFKDGSVSSATEIQSDIVSDEIRKAISGDKSAIQSLTEKGYRVNKLINPLQMVEVGTFEVIDPTTGQVYNYDNTLSHYANMKVKSAVVTASKIVDTLSLEIQSEIESAVNDIMQSPDFGFEPDEVTDYSTVEVSTVYLQGEKYFKVEVRAEVSYDRLVSLSDQLNDILFKYDSGSYFEPETSGIINAYVSIQKAAAAKGIEIDS